MKLKFLSHLAELRNFCDC